MTDVPRSSSHDYLFPGLIWLLALGFVVQAYGFAPASGAVPIMIGWTTVALASIDLFSRMRFPAARAVARFLSPDVQSPSAEAVEPVSVARIATAIGGIVALAAGMVLVGILYTVPVFLFVALHWAGRRSLGTSLLLTVVVTGLLWGTFAGLLRLALYPGLLLGGNW
jgi:hypothetical protein